MSIVGTLYRGVAKRTSTFVLAIAVSAFVFERALDVGADTLWETHNQGKLWKHIKAKYEEKDN